MRALTVAVRVDQSTGFINDSQRTAAIAALVAQWLRLLRLGANGACAKQQRLKSGVRPEQYASQQGNAYRLTQAASARWPVQLPLVVPI
jgi:hypothetical protein